MNNFNRKHFSSNKILYNINLNQSYYNINIKNLAIKKIWTMPFWEIQWVTHETTKTIFCFFVIWFYYLFLYFLSLGVCISIAKKFNTCFGAFVLKLFYFFLTFSTYLRRWLRETKPSTSNDQHYPSNTFTI